MINIVFLSLKKQKKTITTSMVLKTVFAKLKTLVFCKTLSYPSQAFFFKFTIVH